MESTDFSSDSTLEQTPVTGFAVVDSDLAHDHEIVIEQFKALQHQYEKEKLHCPFSIKDDSIEHEMYGTFYFCALEKKNTLKQMYSEFLAARADSKTRKIHSNIHSHMDLVFGSGFSASQFEELWEKVYTIVGLEHPEVAQIMDCVDKEKLFSLIEKSYSEAGTAGSSQALSILYEIVKLLPPTSITGYCLPFLKPSTVPSRGIADYILNGFSTKPAPVITYRPSWDVDMKEVEKLRERVKKAEQMSEKSNVTITDDECKGTSSEKRTDCGSTPASSTTSKHPHIDLPWDQLATLFLDIMTDKSKFPPTSQASKPTSSCSFADKGKGKEKEKVEQIPEEEVLDTLLSTFFGTSPKSSSASYTEKGKEKEKPSKPKKTIEEVAHEVLKPYLSAQAIDDIFKSSKTPE